MKPGDFLATQLPRVLGVLGILSIVIAFWCVCTFEGAIALTPGLLVVGAVYAVYVWGRGRILKQGPPAIASRSLRGLERGTYLFLAISSVALLCLCFLFAIAPVDAGDTLGALAAVLLAIALWVPCIALIAAIAQKSRFPALLVLAGWAVVCSQWNDNHAPLPAAATPGAWRTPCDGGACLKSRFAARAANGKPIVFVTAEGGGIRAAYWTAVLLGRVSDRCPSFRERVAAISSVSGGSLGAAVFATAVNARPDRKSEELADSMLRQDLLSPAIAMLAFPDMGQRLFPRPIGMADRARGLEASWSVAWEMATRASTAADPALALGSLEFTASQADQRSDFSVSFGALFGGRPSPDLLFNSIDVNTGSRFLISNLDFGRGLAAAEDGFNTGLPEVSIATAAHMSARFPYVSPVARIEKDLDVRHVADGGYFDDSGAETLLDVLDLADQRNAFVIVIRNGTSAEASADRWLSELLAPPEAALHAIDAHTETAWTRLLARMHGHVAVPQIRRYAGVDLPLGWSLSRSAADAMQRQIRTLLPRGQAAIGALRDLENSLGDCDNTKGWEPD